MTDKEFSDRGIDVSSITNLELFSKPPRSLTRSSLRDNIDGLLTVNTNVDYFNTGSGWNSDLNSSSITDQVEKRISQLREIAADEFLNISENSLNDLMGFINESNGLRLPSIALVGNGNFRLVWADGENQVGLQFLGDGAIQYVCLRTIDGKISPLMGCHPARLIIKLLRQNEMSGVLAA
jgi:hypothetical protein